MINTETPQQKEQRLRHLHERTKRFPGALKLGAQTVRELADYEREQEAQRLAKQQGVPGGRAQMTRQQKSDYITQHGQQAYLALPR